MPKRSPHRAAARELLASISWSVHDTPWVIEVNPRFQGTVDTVEIAYACNLFQYHVSACAGTLPEAPQVQEYAARRILFADRDMTLNADLKDLAPLVSDIPVAGDIF